MRLDDTGTAADNAINPMRLANSLQHQPLPADELASLHAAVLTVLFHPEQATPEDVATVETQQARHGNITFGLWLAGNPTGAHPAPRTTGDDLAVVVGYGMAAIAATKALVKIDTATRCLSRWTVRRRLRHVLTTSARSDVHAYLNGLCRSASARLTSPDPDKFDIAVSEVTTLLEVLIAAEPFTKVAPDGPDRVGINARATLDTLKDASRAALRAVSAQQRTSS